MNTLFKAIIILLAMVFIFSCANQKQIDNSAKFIQNTTYNISGAVRANGWPWTNYTAANGMAGNIVNGVIVSGGTIYAATNGGVSISADNGTTWTNHAFLGGAVNQIFLDGANLYAVTPGGLYISTNTGVSWINLPIPYTITGDPAIYYAIAQKVYASGANIYAVTAGGLYVSTNSGAAWTRQPLKTTIFSSTSPIGDQSTDNTVNNITGSGATIFAATTAGIYKYANGVTFKQDNPSITVMNGLGSNNVTGIYLYGTSIYAATSNGLSISADNGSTWASITARNGLGSNIVNYVFASGANIYAATSNGLSISPDAGFTWFNYTSEITANGLGSDIIHGVCTSGSNVYASTDSGLSISVSGTGTNLAIGKTAYLIFQNQGNAINVTPLFKSQTLPLNPPQDPAMGYYSINVGTGHYDMYVFIDMNNNAPLTKYLPDTGDLYTVFQVSVVDKDLTFNIDKAQWHTY